MIVKTSPKHRKCKYPQCKQILSIYNHEAYCHVHLGMGFWKTYAARDTAKKAALVA